MRRFISNLAGKTIEFSQLLKLKDTEEFIGVLITKKHLKRSRSTCLNHLLMRLRYEVHLKLYIAATPESIGCLLAQKNDERKEHAIYYLSRSLNDGNVGIFLLRSCDWPYIMHVLS